MALALTRRENESITISTSEGDIVVEVTGINGGQVRMAVTAPRSINIARSELLEYESDT